MTRIKLLLAIGGGALAFLGFQEWKLGRAASATPAEISCAELAANGPGDNAHVVMFDFLLSEQAFVYESTRGSETWKTIWIPAVPLGGEYHQQLMSMVDEAGNLTGDVPLPKRISVIVKSTRVKNEQQLGRLAQADTVQGMVINEVSSLGSKERKMLAESYPGIDFESVWILEHGREPAGSGTVYGMLGGGLALGLLGLGLMVSGRG